MRDVLFNLFSVALLLGLVVAGGFVINEAMEEPPETVGERLFGFEAPRFGKNFCPGCEAQMIWTTPGRCQCQTCGWEFEAADW